MKHSNPFVDNFIFGVRAIEELLNHKSALNKVNKIYVDEKKHKNFSSLLNKARAYKLAVQYVPTNKLDKLARNKNHQGIIAHLLEISYSSLSEILNNTADSSPLILFLDRITDVRNFGSIARSAYAMGVSAILIPPKNTATISADAIKTSSGALLKIPVCREVNIQEALKTLKNRGFQIIACHEKTNRLIEEINFTLPTVVILGSEHNGILKEYLKLCDAEAKIPMSNNFDSLNVAVSAGIVLYEAVRQRKMKI